MDQDSINIIKSFENDVDLLGKALHTIKDSSETLENCFSNQADYKCNICNQLEALHEITKADSKEIFINKGIMYAEKGVVINSKLSYHQDLLEDYLDVDLIKMIGEINIMTVETKKHPVLYKRILTETALLIPFKINKNVVGVIVLGKNGFFDKYATTITLIISKIILSNLFIAIKHNEIVMEKNTIISFQDTENRKWQDKDIIIQKLFKVMFVSILPLIIFTAFAAACNRWLNMEFKIDYNVLLASYISLTGIYCVALGFISKFTGIGGVGADKTKQVDNKNK